MLLAILPYMFLFLLSTVLLLARNGCLVITVLPVERVLFSTIQKILFETRMLYSREQSRQQSLPPKTETDRQTDGGYVREQ